MCSFIFTVKDLAEVCDRPAAALAAASSSPESDSGSCHDLDSSWDLQSIIDQEIGTLGSLSRPTPGDILGIQSRVQGTENKDHDVRQNDEKVHSAAQIKPNIFRRISFRRRSSSSSKNSAGISSSVSRCINENSQKQDRISGLGRRLPRSSSVDAASESGGMEQRQLTATDPATAAAFSRRCWSVGPRPKFPKMDSRILDRVLNEESEEHLFNPNEGVLTTQQTTSDIKDSVGQKDVDTRGVIIQSSDNDGQSGIYTAVRIEMGNASSISDDDDDDCYFVDEE